jgi:hypothetical protein
MEVDQKLRKDKMELEERKDIVGELYKRGLHSLVEKILANTDARTVAVCHQVHKIGSLRTWFGSVKTVS